MWTRMPSSDAHEIELEPFISPPAASPRQTSSELTSMSHFPAFPSVRASLRNSIDPLRGSHAQHLQHEAAASLTDIEDHNVLGVNKLDPHTPLACYDAIESVYEEPMERGYVDGKCRRLLSGEGKRWRFKLFPSLQDLPHVHKSSGFDGSDSWVDIAVPCSVEFAGHGQPLYTNFIYPFHCDPPKIPRSINYASCYQTSFSIPSSWSGRRIIMCFEGVASSFHCWLNGEFVGYSQDSFLPAEFDVTRFVSYESVKEAGGEGEQEGACMQVLSVQVYRFCDGSYMESQDMWLLSGIQRDVVVYSKSQEACVWDYFLLSDFDPSTRSARVTLDVEIRRDWADGLAALQGARREEERGEEELSLEIILQGPNRLDEDGQFDLKRSDPVVYSKRLEVGNGSKEIVCEGNLLFSSSSCKEVFHVENASPWSPESPELYTLILVLRRKDEVVDVEATRVGMRTIQIKDGVLQVNDVPVEVRGVNRHEHDDRKGKYCSRELMVEDLKLMKQLNMNAVRTSHYPNCILFYKLCDAYGLWVCDEANIETHGLVAENSEERLTQDASWEEAFMQRLTRMVIRDRNRPCVLVWSLGNESSYGRNHIAMAAWLREHERSRPVQYEGCGGAASTDIICPMYPSPQQLARLTRLEEQNRRSTELGHRWPQGTARGLRPVIMCEYAHAMNNSLGNFDEFWETIRSERVLQGGFIWDWTDQGMRKETEDGRTCWVYGGFHDEDVHDAQWNINGLTWPDRRLHPSALQAKKVLAPLVIRTEVEEGGRGQETILVLLSFRNLFNFLDLAAFEWRWSLREDGVKILESDLFAFGSVQPNGGEERTQVSISSSSFSSQAHERLLEISVLLKDNSSWAPRGYELTWHQQLLPAKLHVFPLPQEHAAPLRCTSSKELVVVEGGNGFRVEWCRRSGGLRGLWYKDVRIITESEDSPRHVKGLIQNFWRAHTDNDNGGSDTLRRFGATQQIYKQASGFKKDTPRIRGAVSFALWWFNLWGDTSYGSMWEAAGLPDLKPEEVDVNFQEQQEGTVLVVVKYAMRATGRRTRVSCTSTFRVHPTGDIMMEHSSDVSPFLPPLARIGTEFSIGGEFSRLEFYGRGPHETYTDRCSGGKIARHSMSVADTYVPYILPCENGNHCDVRWFALRREDGLGLLLSSPVSGETLHFSAHNFTAQDLYRAKTTLEVPTRKDITVTVDHKHMPCGGNTSWTRAHLEEYLIPPGRYTYSVRMTPIDNNDALCMPDFIPAAPARLDPPSAHLRVMARIRRRIALFMAYVPVGLAEYIVFFGSLAKENRTYLVLVLVLVLVLLVLLVVLLAVYLS